MSLVCLFSIFRTLKYIPLLRYEVIMAVITQYVSLKCWYLPASPHGITTQNDTINNTITSISGVNPFAKFILLMEQLRKYKMRWPPVIRSFLLKVTRTCPIQMEMTASKETIKNGLVKVSLCRPEGTVCNAGSTEGGTKGLPT